MKKYLLLLTMILCGTTAFPQTGLTINDSNYFEMPGLNVMVFHDYYPDSHQSGITIIQHGERVASSGDVRLEPDPGQWSPVPKVGPRTVDKKNNEISTALWFPDSSKNRTGYNPIFYPDLKLFYHIRVKCVGSDIFVFVDLDKPLPQEWVGKVGFNFELFPGAFFGKSFIMDGQPGLFPRQPDGPMYTDAGGEPQIKPMAEGHSLVVAPENENVKMVIKSEQEKLQLLDGRSKYNNGWFVIRSLIPGGKTTAALAWKISPYVIPNWKYQPVVQISQVGYHTNQHKVAVIEQDKSEKEIGKVEVFRYAESGDKELVYTGTPKVWGNFLRYNYLQFDFSSINKPGVYQLRYGKYLTNPFMISAEVYQRHVWQPTLDYFLPVQMCHMKVTEGYRVWHGLCHQDDAIMAMTDTNHFDGYSQGHSTFSPFKPLERVPGLNVGGWHDAGDYDLRIESQADEVKICAMAYEEFNLTYDATTVDQTKKLVEIHKPDGKPDILQQVEHGVLTILNGYNALGRFYRGIQCPTLKQYVLLGDAMHETDNLNYDPSLKPDEKSGDRSGLKDDRWVFTDDEPFHQIVGAEGLAAAARVLRSYNPALAAAALDVAEKNWVKLEGVFPAMRVGLAVELLLTTNKDEYKQFLLKNAKMAAKFVEHLGWQYGRVLDKLNDPAVTSMIADSVAALYTRITNQQAENPYGVPYHPDIWGAGWIIQEFGIRQYFLHKAFPKAVSADYMLNALNFILGCHPGSNTASFASGVGVNSLTTAYGVNRADWSYIPGGVGSGTAIIRPDLPELKVWPFFWQQGEYVMGGGATNFMFLALAADQILNK